MNAVWLAFITGLTTGGISCLAVQGGLLTATVVHRKQAGEEERAADEVSSPGWKYIALFLLAKLLAYTVVGFLLGAIGTLLLLSPKVLGILQIGAGLFMLATAARLANIHPMFRYFALEPPRWAYRLMRLRTKDPSLFTPAILGAMTIFIPCGITQATMVVAVSSGSPWMGAMIMFAFVLGTSPVFFILGAAVLGLLRHKLFSYFAAGIVFLFGILSVNGGLALSGSFYTLQNLYLAATTDVNSLSQENTATGKVVGGIQEVTMDVLNNGYTPSVRSLKAGVPVRLTLKTDGVRSCTRAFMIPDYGIKTTLPETGNQVVEFTPTKTGKLVYTCGMGMYSGIFNVVE